ncbi:ABC transporter ATP-binding protein [Helcococcus ovis]|uniref:ABC transporter ATP-binding protein n=1 Tax=Helcococcus ovis TaxID=72026 RepID=A0A4R9C601_9FIRM|nr:ABC transporter ATP-binding protein [Helcococcus ovis]TFF65641.1 ABC transporter ATP-binding protein [Helcococcus ovis]TFF66279.1 ABC transporter ATP-binding protein [Helcococcus ovis]TFF67523.1 ABC transporter ATP-binding protein [Helcococcus ovis]WNZ01699.1 ABC transporter ATP-binding protein [Helcococcus ovis]
MSYVEVKNLYFGYSGEYVLKNLNLKIEKGSLIAITGENGSGKSTLLKLILGEIKPDKGTILFDNQDISKIKSFKQIGYVPQVQNFEKIAFPITCLELVTLNQYEDFGFIKIARRKHKEKAKHSLINLGLENYINTPFNELSGGLQQRVIIARAMINNPQLLILDEPTAGVDKNSKKDFLHLIEKINKESKVTVLIVTHELELINKTLNPSKIYKIEDGGISYV